MITIPAKCARGRACVLDVETTGLNPKISEVLQLAVVDADSGDVVHNKFYDAHLKCWPEAEAVNGITKAMVAGLPYLADEADEVSRILDDYDVIVGYNVGFDIEFLRRAGVKIRQMVYVDLMIDYSEMVGTMVLKRWKLSQAAAWAGCEIFKAHDAVFDSLATLTLFKRMQEVRRWPGFQAGRPMSAPSTAASSCSCLSSTSAWAAL